MEQQSVVSPHPQKQLKKIAFLYINNQLEDIKGGKNVIVVTQNIKYLGVNLERNVKTSKRKTLKHSLGDIEVNWDKWKEPFFLVRADQMIKMSVFCSGLHSSVSWALSRKVEGHRFGHRVRAHA